MEAKIDITYLNSEGLVKVHTVSAEIEREGFICEVREVAEDIPQDGFFLVMEDTRYVFVPGSQVLQIEFDLVDTEDGS